MKALKEFDKKYPHQADVMFARNEIRNFIKEKLEERDNYWKKKIGELPTGMFDSTPYKKKLLDQIKNNLKK